MKVYDLYCRFAVTMVAPVANFVARIYIGVIFFRSGLLKLEDFDETIENFIDVYPVPFLSAEAAAYSATAGELILPVLLFIGLFTRIGAAGLMVMALVIEIWVFPGMVEHYYWMLILSLLIGYGGDKLSLDYLIFKRK
jgi:putative oxidoreductase